MQQGRVPYQAIVFVCTNQRDNGEACCADRASAAILEALKSKVKAKGLSRRVRVSRSGCHDVCAKGPSVMVFPEYAWYYGVTEADADRILEAIVTGLPPRAGTP